MQRPPPTATTCTRLNTATETTPSRMRAPASLVGVRTGKGGAATRQFGDALTPRQSARTQNGNCSIIRYPAPQADSSSLGCSWTLGSWPDDQRRYQYVTQSTEQSPHAQGGPSLRSLETAKMTAWRPGDIVLKSHPARMRTTVSTRPAVPVSDGPRLPISIAAMVILPRAEVRIGIHRLGTHVRMRPAFRRRRACQGKRSTTPSMAARLEPGCSLELQPR